MADISQHLAVSHKVEFEDLDWETGRRIGLAPDEIESLLYFADIDLEDIRGGVTARNEHGTIKGSEMVLPAPQTSRARTVTL